MGSHPFRNILMRCEPRIQELLGNESTPDAQRDGLKDTLLWVQQLGRSIRMYDAEERARKMLRVLGFDEVGQKKLCSALSGGLRMRVALCMAFFIEADLLLLDEPTNHLDFPSVLWLENRLRGYKSAFLMVSHDRELLNNVCTSVLLLEDRQIKYYQMGFKEFEKKKATEDKKKFDEIEKFLQKNVNVDPSTLLGKQKHEKKMWSDSYYQKQVALAGKFTFPTSTPLSNTEKDAEGKAIHADNISLINLQNVRFSYDVSTGHFIFNDPISFNVTATTRCGVMGPNGAGQPQRPPPPLMRAHAAHRSHASPPLTPLSPLCPPPRVSVSLLSACRQVHSAQAADAQADADGRYRGAPPGLHAGVLRPAQHRGAEPGADAHRVHAVAVPRGECGHAAPAPGQDVRGGHDGRHAHAPAVVLAALVCDLQQADVRVPSPAHHGRADQLPRPGERGRAHRRL